MADNLSAGALPLTIRTNFTWNFIGKLTYAFSRAAVLMIIAKLGSPEMVGQYALAFAVTSPVFMLADLDLRSILATDAKNASQFGEYLGLRLVTSILGMAAVLVIALLQGGGRTGLVILLVGASKGIESISDMFFGLLQKNERLDKLGISLIFKGILSAAAMVLPLLFLHSLTVSVAGVAAALTAVLLLYDIPAARPYADIRIKTEPKTLFPLLRLSIPLGVVLLFGSLIKNLPNYFIKTFYGVESLGYFSSMIYIMSAGSLVASALSQSASARLARCFSRGDTEGFTKLFLRILFFTLSVGALMFLAAAAAGREILSFLYRPEYAAWQNVFLLVTGAAGISYSAEITMNALTAARRFKVQPIACGFVLLTGLALNFFLVPKTGLWGAGLCVLLSSCLQLIINLSLLSRSVGKRKEAVSRKAAQDSEGGLSVSNIPGSGELNQEAVSAWKELLDRSGSEAVFADPDLLSVWRRAFGKSGDSILLEVCRKGELTAVFPFTIIKKHFASRVSFMGFPQASHMDVACRKEDLDETAAAIIKYLRERKGAGVIRLTGLREEGGLFRALNRRLDELRIPQLSGSAPSPVIRTGGRKYEGFYKNRFSSHAIKNNKRDENRLAKLGRVSVRRLTGGDMAEAFRLHDLRWRKKLDTSGFTGRESREFFTALPDAGGNRWQTLALGLYLEDRLIAFQYGFICKTRALLYKSAHDDLFGIYAPGKMIKREYIRRCFDMGIKTIDLGVGYEEYKEEWTDERDSIRYLSFPRDNLPSYVFFLFHYVKGKLRDRIKQSRKAVLFKRNTLGLLKYRLSGERAKDACRRKLELIRRQRLISCFHDPAGKAKRVTLHFRGKPRPVSAVQGSIRKAVIDDVEEIALLMNCAPSDVVRRFYRLQRCYLAGTGRPVACLAWVAEGKNGVVISDFRADKRFCRGEDTVSLLRGILADLPEGDFAGVTIQAGPHGAAFIRAALQTGFSPGVPEDQKTAGRGKGRVGNADFNHT